MLIQKYGKHKSIILFLPTRIEDTIALLEDIVYDLLLRCFLVRIAAEVGDYFLRIDLANKYSCLA